MSVTDSGTSDASLARTVAPNFAPVSRQRFDEYVIVGRLGHGGMAEVFLAMSEGVSGFRKLIVIKRLYSHMADEEAVVQMFLDEAKLASRLNHPNVVQTNKVGVWENQYFLAMEYLEGQPLNRVLARAARAGSNVPIALGVKMVSDALDGLHYAHEARDYDGTPLAIVHRDISPHNLFITYEGTVKLLDFGIAKAATQEARTGTGLVKGKFAYMAPEQAAAEPIDRRADLWSMGVVLWETLTGCRLFKGKTDAATLQMTMSAQVPPMREARTDVPPALERIARKALTRDPEKRYQSALEMKEELDEWLAGESRSSSRAALGGFMTQLFGPQIEEQRAMIKASVESEVEGSLADVTGTHVATQTGSVSLGAVSAVLSDGSGSHSRSMPMVVSEAPQRSNALLRVVAALLALITVAVVALLVSNLVGGRRDAPQVATTGATATQGVTAAAPASEQAPAVSATTPPPSEAVAATPSASAPADDSGEDGEKSGAATGKAPSGPRPRGGGPAPAKTSETAEEPPKDTEYGFLTIATTPWSIVSVGGRTLGQTPVVGAKLPVGTHTLTLKNPELGITQAYTVTIVANQTTTKRVAIQ